MKGTGIWGGGHVHFGLAHRQMQADPSGKAMPTHFSRLALSLRRSCWRRVWMPKRGCLLGVCTSLDEPFPQRHTDKHRKPSRAIRALKNQRGPEKQAGVLKRSISLPGIPRSVTQRDKNPDLPAVTDIWCYIQDIFQQNHSLFFALSKKNEGDFYLCFLITSAFSACNVLRFQKNQNGGPLTKIDIYIYNLTKKYARYTKTKF